MVTNVSSIVVTNANPVPSDDEIAQRAYRLWECEGRPAGRERSHWLLAKAILRAERAQRHYDARMSAYEDVEANLEGAGGVWRQ